VLDRSQTVASRRLVSDVQATGYFLPPRPVGGYEEGRALLRRGRALAFLVVPETFRRDMDRGHPRVQLLLDGSDPLTAARVGAYVGQVAATFAPARDATPAWRPDRLLRAPGAIDVRQRFWFNPTLDDHRFFLTALAGMLLTNLCLSVTSLALVGEREAG